MAGLQIQTSRDEMKTALRMIGLSYRSIAKKISHGKREAISDTTVRRVLLGMPGQFCSDELRAKIWQVVNQAKADASARLASLKIPGKN